MPCFWACTGCSQLFFFFRILRINPGSAAVTMVLLASWQYLGSTLLKQSCFGLCPLYQPTCCCLQRSITNSVPCLYAEERCARAPGIGEQLLCSYTVDVRFLADIAGLRYLHSQSTCPIAHPRHGDEETVECLLWEASLIPTCYYKSCLFAIWLSRNSYVSFPHAKWDCGTLPREQPLCTNCDHLDSGTVIPPTWQWRIGNVCPRHLIKHSHASERGAWIFSLF